MSQATDEPKQLEHKEQRSLFVELTEDDWKLIAEAGDRCDLSPADFLLEAALAQARRIVPAACRPSGVEAPMTGLFAEGKSIGV